MAKNAESEMSNLKSKISNPQSLRVLIVEDSEDDALLTILALEKGGYDPVYERVEDAGAMRKTLLEKPWDVILCDYQLPQFNGLAAITLLKETGIDIPLIIVSGAIGEETAVECMRFGACDYIMKGNLSRLVSAIERELKEADSRLQRKWTEETLRESEGKYRSFTNSTSDIVFLKDDEFKHIMVNRACLDFYKSTEAEILDKTDFDFMTEIMARNCRASDTRVIESNKLVVAIEQDEDRIFETRKFPVRLKDGKIGIGGIVRDITAQKRAEEALRKAEEMFRLITENMVDCVALVDTNGTYQYVTPSYRETLGYDPEDMIGISGFSITHPDDLERVFKLYWEGIEQGWRETSYETRTRHKDGHYVPMEIRARSLNDPQGKIVGGVIAARDITQRQQSEKKRRDAEEKYRSIFENAVEGIFQTTADGRFLSSNPALAHILGYESPEDLMASVTNIGGQLYVSHEAREEHLRVITEKGQAKGFEAQIRRKDGSIRWISMNTRLVRDDVGNPMHYEGFVEDINVCARPSLVFLAR